MAILKLVLVILLCLPLGYLVLSLIIKLIDQLMEEKRKIGK